MAATAIATVIGAFAPEPAPAIAAEASATAIKAAFLYKFGYFVEWPSSAFAAPDSPVSLCIVGADPFGAALDDAIRNQKIGDRPFTIHRLAAVSRDSGCHIVYLAGADNPQATQMLAALRGSAALTVTDAGADSGEAGIINFVIKDDRVRFDIDDAAAAAGGLTISSRLLNLALSVKPRH